MPAQGALSVSQLASQSASQLVRPLPAFGCALVWRTQAGHRLLSPRLLQHEKASLRKIANLRSACQTAGDFVFGRISGSHPQRPQCVATKYDRGVIFQ